MNIWCNCDLNCGKGPKIFEQSGTNRSDRKLNRAARTEKNPLAISNCALSLFPESDDLKCFSCSVNILVGIAIKTVERIKDIWATFRSGKLMDRTESSTEQLEKYFDNSKWLSFIFLGWFFFFFKFHKLLFCAQPPKGGLALILLISSFAEPADFRQKWN